MARPFPNTFEKDSPMTPQSAASNISYQTNIDRKKTQKWANAKPVSYGGDDWGDDDDYDYDPPPPPPPASKPMGARQPSQPLPPASNFAPPTVDNGKRYADLPPVPGPSGHGRTHSFDADDEKRNFSSTTVRQPSPPPKSTGPATRFSQITGVPTVRNPNGPPPTLHISTQQPTQPQPVPRQTATPVTSSPHPEVLLPGRVNTGETGSVASPASELVTPSTASDYHARRDFSPSAVPQPLTTRASPAPQSATESTSSKFPPRRSSLSQAGPPLEEITRDSAEQTTPKPWTAGRDASPGASSRSPTSPSGKALPFIRPADIYKRAEEEKIRQSLESGRPSMDSILGRPGESSESPIHQLRHKTSSESLGSASRRRMSNEGDEVADSGRRLMPMLDTVRERKSEYGFDGFNVNETAPQEKSRPEPEAPLASHLDVEEARRQSTSPKLPDLNRISGFGMDMFSQPDLSLNKDSEVTPTTASTIHDSSANDAELALRTQPSLGFRSVVNQAFDTAVPPTPASQSGSGVKRTDSESTGTTGISPIISRASSSAVPGSRNPEMSILEVVNEPNSPESAKGLVHETQPEHEVPAFKMGHRRDISAPNNGNSPARTPDVGTTPPILSSGQSAELSLASPEITTAGFDEPLRAPRPTTDREPSFRPALPGGWTSYATTSTTEPPVRTVSRKQTPAQKAEDEDLTPTTAKQSLPPSSFQAAAVGAALVGSTAAMLGKHDDNIPVTADNSRHVPTPDHTMAPSGSVYSAAALDPRVLPKLEQAPAETQLRPDTAGQGNLGHSNARPTPPPKDTPKIVSVENTSGYFPNSTAPFSTQNPSVQPVETVHSMDASTGAESLETVNSATPPSDDENDKLHEEIVKSLTPQPSDAARQDDSVLSDELDESNYVGQGRESTYLPSEYDNYWASTDEGNKQPQVVSDPSKSNAGGTSNIESPSTSEAHRQPEPVIEPLSPRRDQETGLQPPRPTLQNRFSWEKSTEDVSVAHPPSHPSVAPTSTSASVSELPAQEVPIRSELDASPPERETSLQPSSSPYDTGEYPVQAQPGASARDAGILAGAGAAAVGGVAAVTYAHNQSSQHQRRLSLAEEKDPTISTSSYPVSPTPPEDEHPARSPKPYLPLSTDSHTPAPPSTVSPVDTPIQQHFSPVTKKLISFKEITAISSPQQRIQTFNDTRQYWASIDPGLSDWMMRLQGQYPEHAGATAAWGNSRAGMPVGSARSKFGKSSAAAQPLQQPYYQQYLNASSPTATSPSTPTKAGPGPGPSFNQPIAQLGPAPSGNKMSTHQVQAKGKEFLHTAGIFGGKAGKAGKGLLAKGKNKLRAAGGGDKTSSPPPKPKNERRSSWGLPLNLTRSNRHDGSPRQSKDSTPTPTFQRSRAATTTSGEPSAVPDISSLGSGFNQSQGIMSGALPIEQQPSPMTPPAPTVRQVIEEPHASSGQAGDQYAGDLDDHRPILTIPAPISKNQPSWDPFNAAPIAEEGTQVEEPTRERQFSSESAGPRPSLSVVNNAVPASERSTSDEAHYFDAAEEPTDLNNDWVMVSPNHESKEALSKEDPVIVSPIEEPKESPPQDILATDMNQEHASEIQTEPERPHTPNLEIPKAVASPTTSIINRPRGSSYDIPIPPPSAKSAAFSSNSPSAPGTSSAAARTSFDVPPPVLESVQNPPPKDPVQQGFENQNSSSSFLPPIRRTSTFGLGFGSRHPRPRFPIEDADETTPSPPPQPLEVRQSAPAIQAPAPVMAAMGPGLVKAEDQIQARPFSERQEMRPPQTQLPSQGNPRMSGPVNSHQPNPSQFSATRELPFHQQNKQGPMWTNRPPLTQAGSSNYNQPPIPMQGEPGRAPISPPRGAEILQRPEFNESQVEWRQARPKATAPVLPTSALYNKEIDLPPPRNNSWEPETEQAITRPTQPVPPEPQYDEKPTWSGPPHQQRPYEQPPSSAQRYPELFRSGQPGPHGQPGAEVPRGSADLPAQYYQAPISRAAAFLPRQQTNEYQLPGVGPPEPPMATRRNSGFWKEIGERVHSRASSRDRRSASISRQQRRSNSVSHDQPLSRGSEYANSIAPSEAAQERQRKRSSFFGALHTSTSGIGTPASRESVIAHPGASRTDLVATPPTPSSPIAQHERKKSLFGGNHVHEPKQKPGKLTRASTGTSGAVEGSKKNRFSGLSSMFGKPSNSTRTSVQNSPQSVRELSHHERQPLESPLLISTKPRTPLPPVTPALAPRNRSPSQSRNVFSKLAHSTTSLSTPSKEAKQRRSSGGLLGGFMSRKAHTDRGSDDSRSQGSTSQRTIQPVLLSQTYTDLQNETPHTPPPQTQPQARPSQVQRTSNQNLGVPTSDRADRGRRTSREQRPQPYVEPQYDSVPIPGGYQLVRGQGAIPVHTDYDPRGLNRMQQPQQHNHSPVPSGSPRYAPPPAQQQYPPGGPSRVQQTYPVQQAQTRTPQQKPTLGAIETFQNYKARAPQHLSREDLLARSPPKSLEGQQRPYQISLPGGEDDDVDEETIPLRKDPIAPSSSRTAQGRGKPDTILRLQQPILRHPESPAGYPLPDDTVFSPINPGANDIPPPPPPKWPSHLDNQQGHDRQLSMSTMGDVDLDRSNTRRTAVSAVSGFSNHEPGASPPAAPVSQGLNVPGKDVAPSERRGRGNSLSSPSPTPTPPSPMQGSPERGVSPEMAPHASDIRRTEVRLPPRPTSQEDLYNASPRLPKPARPLTNSSTNGNGSHSNGTNYSNGSVVKNGALGNESENHKFAPGMAMGAGGRVSQEEKIPYGPSGALAPEEEAEPATMSATSYPGQEWNPYMAGGWDDGYD